MLKNITSTVVLLLFSFWGLSQPFINEINHFKKIDSLQPPPKNPILLVGSSSFTNWKDVQEYFPSHTLLNRGFGGSSLPHLLLYAEEVIFKYDPKQIIIYCGENDLSGGTHINADTVTERVKSLFYLIRGRLPSTPIVYISMKPSPSRRKYLGTMRAANQQIQRFLEAQPQARFLDVFSSMLTPAGEIRGDIFVSDSLHMNKKGYQIWKPLLEPLLLKTTNNFYPATDANIMPVGRFEKKGETMRMWASGAHIRFRFKGSNCYLDLEDENRYNDHQNYLSIIVDNQPPSRIKLMGRKSRIALAENLAPGVHEVTICKDTEAGIGFVQVNGIICESLSKPPKPIRRRIEFYGNSITCGMGSDQGKVACKQGAWYDQHNAWLAYGPTLSRRLNADWHLTSESGIGLMKSCCNKKIIMPKVFDKININGDSLVWDFNRYQPQLVSICLGQNDGIQDSSNFVNNYISFLRQIRKVYPKATLLLLNSPMADPSLHSFLDRSLNAIKQQLHSDGEKKLFTYSFKKRYINGCDAHPSLEEHKEIADELEGVVRRMMRGRW